MNLLIVEDHPTSRKLLRVQLEAEGHNVVEATNGREALGLIGQSPIEGVISDILMPEMDGFRLCYEIRKTNPPGPRIPVVLYTGTFFTAADRQLAQSLGANGFICKPASPAVILAALRDRAANPGLEEDAPPQTIEESVILEYYNRALVRKLDERNTQLRQSLAQVHRAHEEILELNHTLETRIAQRTAELEAANFELESISRTVVRELRAPLQTIAANAERVEVALATRRMNQLLDTLEDFVRLGATPINRVTLDLDSLVDEALLAVRAEIAERSIQWERHTLPLARGDPALLRLVFTTLISNAIRSTQGCQTAIIEIGSRRGRADEIVVFIRDNGMGVATSTLAQPLEGLAPIDGAAGRAATNPIPLANVHRILGRHGGRLWCEAAVGSGATYSFSLPQEHGEDPHHR